MLIVEYLSVTMVLKQYILCFNISKHESNIYRSRSTAGIEIKLLLDQTPANPYSIYYVIFSERKAIMEVIA